MSRLPPEKKDTVSPDRMKSSPDPSISWIAGTPRVPVPIGLMGCVRAGYRGGAILGLLALGFPLLLALRLPERAICGAGRPLTPWITQAVCVATCAVLGLKRRQIGAPMTGPGGFVANHVSWLDIFVLNAAARVAFVAKAEIRAWPGIGSLARGTGTIFVERQRRQAKVQEEMLGARLSAGLRIMVFPEGTSSDGLRVLPFKSTILGAFFAAEPGLAIQPVTLRYQAPPGRDARFYGWWAGLGFGRSLLEVLAQGPQGSVEVIWHAPIPCDGADRKSLAAKAEDAVRSGLEG